MPIKSTQIIPVQVTVGAATIKGTCTIIKWEHQKSDPTAQGIPQREIIIKDESGATILKIKKFFRHVLLESGNSFETTQVPLRLTPDVAQRMAEHILALPGDSEDILSEAMGFLRDD